MKQTRMVDYITETVMNEQLASNPSVEWTAKSWGIQIENVFYIFCLLAVLFAYFPAATHFNRYMQTKKRFCENEGKIHKQKA